MATDRTVHPHEVRLFRPHPHAHPRRATRPRSGRAIGRRERAGLSHPSRRDDGDGPEVGAGWKRTGEKAGDYVSLLLDDPALTQPIRANLFQSDDEERPGPCTGIVRRRAMTDGRDAIACARPANPIPLFVESRSIPSSRSAIRRPSRAAKVKGGRGRRTRLALDGGEHDGTLASGRGDVARVRMPDHNGDRAGDDAAVR